MARAFQARRVSPVCLGKAFILSFMEPEGKLSSPDVLATLAFARLLAARALRAGPSFFFGLGLVEVSSFSPV